MAKAEPKSRAADARELVSPEPETETHVLAPSFLCVIFSRLFCFDGALWSLKFSALNIILCCSFLATVCVFRRTWFWVECDVILVNPSIP